MVSLSRIPNKFGLDPFLAIDTTYANFYFGRVDVAPDRDPEQGLANAITAAAHDEDPELDPTLPWPLLIRGMFSMLYKKADANFLRRRGKKKREFNDPLPPPIIIKPRDWARAFNIITYSYVNNGFLKRPNRITRRRLDNGREVALAFLVQDPGKGRDKTNDYLSRRRRRETIRVIRRMESHRLELGEDPDVQKHLKSVRVPAVL